MVTTSSLTRFVAAVTLATTPYFFAADAGAEKKPTTVDLEARVKELEKRVKDLEAELQQTRDHDVFGGFRERHNFGRDFDDIFNKLQRELDRDLGPGFNPFGSGGPRGMVPGNKPRMGVELAEPTDELRERFKNDVKEGAFVMSVVPGSPADKAALNVGDAVTSFNGKAVTGPRDLIDAVKNAPQGKNDIVVTRRGESLKLKVDLGEALAEAPEDTDFQPGQRPQNGWLRRGEKDPFGGGTRSRTEVKASALELDEKLAKDLKLTDDQRKKMNEILDKHAKALNQEVAQSQGVKHTRRNGGFSINIGGDVNKMVEKHAQDAEKELSGTLSAEQIAKWSEYRKSHSSVSFSQSTTIEGGGQRPGQVEDGGLGF